MRGTSSLPPPAGYCADPLVPFNGLESYPTLPTTPQTGGNDCFSSASILNGVSDYSVLLSTGAIPLAEYAVTLPTFDSTTNQARLSLATLPEAENWPDGTGSLTTLQSLPLFASPTTDTTYSAGCSPLSRFEASPGLYEQSTPSCSRANNEQVAEHIAENSTRGGKSQGGQSKRTSTSEKPGKRRTSVSKPKGKGASASILMPSVASTSPPPPQPNRQQVDGNDDDDDNDRVRRFSAAASQRERNRLAATKCRLKTKAAVQLLEAESFAASRQRASLLAEARSLWDEVLRLRSQLLYHHDCNCALINTYLQNAARAISETGGRVRIWGARAARDALQAEYLGARSGTGSGPGTLRRSGAGGFGDLGKRVNDETAPERGG